VATWLGAPIAVGISSTLAVVAALVFYLVSRNLRELDSRVEQAMGQE
jgi:hypothetical protein